MPKHADLNPMERGLLLGALLASGGVVDAAFIRRTFGVSRPTASRDLLVIETTLRTETGANQAGGRTVFLKRKA